MINSRTGDGDESVMRPDSVASQSQKSQQGKVVATAMIGSVIEWFDFLVYATVSSLVFGQLFFPNDSQFISTLLALSTFAMGYLARPVGGLLFAHMGDKHGRQRVLFMTFILMGAATVLIGLLPTYATLGVAAPVLLIILRLCQGLGAGGEYGAAVVMVVEHGNASGKRGFFGALTSSGASGGFLLASALLAVLTGVLTEAQFEAWGWRIPFLLSFSLLAVGFYLRLRIEETPIMKESLKEGEVVKTPLFAMLKRYPREITLALLLPTAILAGYQIVNVFSVPYITEMTTISASSLLTMLTIGQAVYLVSMVTAGWWSDKVGRRRPMMIGAISLGVWGFVFFPLVLSGSEMKTLLAVSVALLCTGMIFGPMATFMSEIFATDVRATGVSFAYQINAAIVGGLTPVVSMAVANYFGSWIGVAALLALACAISFGAIFLSRDNFRADLSDVHASESRESEMPAEITDQTSARQA